MRGDEMPWDGQSQSDGVSWPWIASGYYRMDPNGANGCPTGDVGVVDKDGFDTLTDRAKDLVKSGGEWISSIEMENIAVAHPDVAKATAIAVPDAKWGERPLLIVVARAGCVPDPAALREFCRGKLPDWSLPDRVVIADSIPHGADPGRPNCGVSMRAARAQVPFEEGHSHVVELGDVLVDGSMRAALEDNQLAPGDAVLHCVREAGRGDEVVPAERDLGRRLDAGERGSGIVSNHRIGLAEEGFERLRRTAPHEGGEGLDDSRASPRRAPA